MTYIIKEYENYNEQEILDLYKSVEWDLYIVDSTMLKNAYNNSLKTDGAYVDDKLVGIIRVVGDGYSVVFIQDLLIRPEFQRQGIGRALMKRIIDEYKGVYQMHLLTDNTEKTIGFYKSMGFIMDTDINCRAFTRLRI